MNGFKVVGEYCECGHNHRSIKTAEKCKDKLQKIYYPFKGSTGETAAKWYHADIKRFDGSETTHEDYCNN